MPGPAKQQTRTIQGAVAEHALPRVLAVIWPWIGWLIAAPVSALVLHLAWDRWWAALAVVACALILAAVDLYLTHERKSLLGRYLSPVTSLAVGSWLAVADLRATWSGTWFGWLVGGGFLAIVWSRWMSHHAGEDSLGHLFGKEAEELAGVSLKVVSQTVRRRKAEGTARLPAGTVAEAALEAAKVLESAKGWPRGSIQFRSHAADARQVDYTIANPLLLDRPHPWPGPSAPGASIARPLRLGIRADGEPELVTVPGNHWLVNGCTGSAKTTGGMWNTVSEEVTRYDAAVLVMDLTKGEQTVGPLRPALHGCAVTLEHAKKMFDALDAVRLPRTNYLASKGRQQWEEGCGLTHLTIMVEEGSDIVRKLPSEYMDIWTSLLTGIRSAGCRLVLSTQLSRYDMMPTFFRSQTGAIVFGLNDHGDPKLALSSRQYSSGQCEPEEWGKRFPGKHYIDVDGMDPEGWTQPHRTFDFGRDDSLIRAHCLANPHTARQLDPVTAPAMAEVLAFTHGLPAPAVTAQSPIHLVPPRAAEEPPVHTDTDQPGPPIDPAAVEEGLAVDIRPGQLPRIPFTSTGEGEVSPEQAREILFDQIDAWHGEGRTEFSPADLGEVCIAAGRGRTWPYKLLDSLAADGVLQVQDNPRRYLILKRTNAA
jgi:hypothetical protein